MHAMPFDLGAYLEVMLHHAGTLLPLDSAAVLLRDAETGVLIPRAVIGARDAWEAVEVSENLTGQGAENGQAVIVNDARHRYADPAARAALEVPIMVGAHVAGLLSIESHRPNAYTATHKTLAQTLSEQIAAVLQLAEAYQHVRQERDELRDTTRSQERETRALKRLADITSTTLNFDDMLVVAVREAADLLDCDGARVLMPDSNTYSLAVHVLSCFGVAQAWDSAALPLDGEGHAVHVYHTGEPYINNAPDPDAGPDCHCRLIYPLNTRNRTLGVLELANQRGGQFSEANLENARTIAGQIAVSMDSVRRLVAEQRRTELLGQINHISQELYATLDPQDLLHHMAQLIHEVFGYDAVHVMLLTPDGQAVQVQAAARGSGDVLPGGYALPVDVGVLSQVLRTGQSVIIPDIREITEPCPLADVLPDMQSCLVVSLRQGDETIGTITISSRQLYAFNETDRDALEMLGRQLSVALENAHLYHQAQRRLIEQGIVHQIGQDLSAILDYRELVEAIVRHMNHAINASACLLGLYEADQAAVRIEADFRAPRHRAPDGATIAGQYLALETHPAIRDAIRSREPVTTYRDAPDTSDRARAILAEIGDHSQLIVPVVAGERVIGIVIWTDNQPGRRFTADDIALARTLVAQGMIALENALLFKELEQRADELAEAYQLRSQFLATISHELRTPMNSIIGFSETLIDGIYGELTGEQASRLDRIRRNGYSLLAMIDDLLDLSKIEAGRMTLELEMIGVGDAALTAVDSLRPQADAKGLSVVVDIAPDLPRVEADPQRLYQVIKNLLSNAIKFTHEGGITLRCQRVEYGGRPMIQASVTDTGIGISPDAQAYIFDSFRQVDGSSTRAYSGTGMGLAISKRLIEMMGGTIWVDSVAGEGSTFSFTLPVAKSERLLAE